MSTDQHNSGAQFGRQPRHSALEELRRDERRPAVLLLGVLVIAAIFFALGIMVGRWTIERKVQPVTSPGEPVRATPAYTPEARTP